MQTYYQPDLYKQTSMKIELKHNTFPLRKYLINLQNGGHLFSVPHVLIVGVLQSKAPIIYTKT